MCWRCWWWPEFTCPAATGRTRNRRTPCDPRPAAAGKCRQRSQSVPGESEHRQPKPGHGCTERRSGQSCWQRDEFKFDTGLPPTAAIRVRGQLERDAAPADAACVCPDGKIEFGSCSCQETHGSGCRQRCGGSRRHAGWCGNWFVCCRYSAQFDELEKTVDQLSNRAAAVNSGLDHLQQQQAASGYGLRADMVERQASLKSNLFKAEEALQHRDAARAKKYADLAEADAEVLERFLGH